MNKTIATTLITGISLLTCSYTMALDDGALYQWVTEDGTPTYSPEPPPAGTDYLVVDANLQPIANQPAKKNTPAIAAAAPVKTPVDLTTAPKVAAAPKWKPVRYAQDPSLSGKRGQKTKNSTQGEAEVATMTTANPATSDTCLLLKREQIILENAFAKATSDQEMDQAVLNLKQKSEQYRTQCTVVTR